MRHLTSVLLLALGLATGSVAVAGAPALAAPTSDLDLTTRAALLREVEAVRHGHRAWPDANDAARPALETLAPAGFFLDKAADSVRKSLALEHFWGRAITGAELQAEMDRMVRSSKQPDRLAEIFAALGNDPRLIAEVVARPLLADRRIREWYAQDERFHGDLEAQARAEAEVAATAPSLQWMSGEYLERELNAEIASGRGATDPEMWDQQVERLARRFGVGPDDLQVGKVSRLLEDAGRFYVLSIIERSADRIRIASVEWQKVPFATWWAQERPQFATQLAAGEVEYILPTLLGEPCLDDSWRPTLSIPEPRYEHTAVWTGSEMIVWGGFSSVGNFPDQNGRYEPATDSWSFVSEIGEPGVRAEHSAVWTGTEMIVWGGFGLDPANTGGRYNPVTDTWQATTLAGAPSARWDHVAVWTGSEMILWGGGNGVSVSSGGRYDPTTDSWTPTTLANAPEGRDISTAVWTGTEMIIWGGFRNPFTLDTGGRYNPATDTWQATSLVGVPSFRHFHTAVWTGTEMIVWGGVGVGFGTSTGARYDPATDSWQPTSTVGAPSPRWLQEAIWTGDEMIIWGGTILLADHPISGGRYDPDTDSWTPTSQVNVPEGREASASVWTGTEMIVWGGLGDEYFVSTGGRYDPVADSWLPTPTLNVPTARGLHTAAWTGTEMMIYGGDILGEPGGLYDPATDSWRQSNEVGAPFGIQNMTSIWTGSEVIVWGGFPETNRGGRYNPLTDSWTPTSLAGAPIPRYWHSAVWTGGEMIIWGGWPVVNSGGRYDPTTDSWTPTSLAGAPSVRDSQAAVWTGTEMIIWAGAGSVAGQSGGRYDPMTDSWTPVSTVGAPPARWRPSTVWTGTEMIVWSGFGDAGNTGGRYNPTTDSWQPTSLVGAPSALVTPAVWTGDEMIVWGGDLQAPTGARYNPLGDNWVPTTHTGAPHGRWNTSLVWTGDEMIAWGGIINTATGGLYCARLEGNQIPIARDDQYSMSSGGRLRIPMPGVLGNDTDGNGDTLRARLVDPPANGTMRLRGDGSFMYRPASGFAGTDTFTYQARDGQAASPLATVSIEVECTTNCLRVVTIVIDTLLDLTRSRIWVETETGADAAGATVSATWTLPDGGTIASSGVTDAFGQATLDIPDHSSGTFFIEIDDVVKTGFTFDPINSVLIHGKTR